MAFYTLRTMRRIVYPFIAQTAAISSPSAKADGVSAAVAGPARRRRLPGAAAAVLLAGWLAGSPADALTIALPITNDTHVDSRIWNGAENWNFGADHTDKVVVNSKDTPTSLCRALFRLPDGLWLYAPSQIVSARVIFYVWQDNSGDRGVTLYPLTTNFVQGSGSKYQQPDPVDGATWWTRDGTNAWSATGGDFDTNYPVLGVKEEILDENTHDRFFHWDITALLTNTAARANLQAHGALLKIDEEPHPPSGTQFWAAFTSSHDPAYQPPYQPYVAVDVVPIPTVPFRFAWSNGAVAIGISNLTVQATNVVERSLDLTRTDGWSIVTSFTARAGVTNWTDPLPVPDSNVFYRLRSLP